MRTYPPAEDRFLSRVQPSPDGCLIWTGAKDSYGYGVMKVGKKNIKVHRFQFEREVGPLPKDKLVMHMCDNPLCVEPSHLIAGTNADNMSDKTAKRRQYRRVGRKQKLNDLDVLAIRASTELYRELAERHGVTLATIKHIRSRKTWK